MGIGRRRFLRFTAAALGQAAIDPGVVHAAVSVTRGTYLNRVLGLGFVVPDGWHLQQGRDFSFLRRDTTLLGMDEELRRALDEDPHTDPVAVLSAVPVDEFAATGRYGPSIVLHFDPAPSFEDFADGDEIVDRYVALLAELMPAFEIRRPLERGRLSECDTWTVGSRFTFDHPKLSAPVVNETTTIVAMADEGVYTVHLHDAPAIGEGAADAHRRFLDSLVIM